MNFVDELAVLLNKYPADAERVKLASLLAEVSLGRRTRNDLRAEVAELESVLTAHIAELRTVSSDKDKALAENETLSDEVAFLRAALVREQRRATLTQHQSQIYNSPQE